MELEGKGVVVTGGSKGLGRALALALARRGARVFLVARGAEALEATLAEVRRAGGQAHGLAADVGDKLAVHPIAAAAQEVLGQVDVVVHAASSLGPLPMPLLLDTACEDLASVLETNVLGPFRLTKLLAAPMALRGEGTVLFVSSDAAVDAYPRWGAYGISKAAADHLARVLAAELGEAGVRVLSVDPGEMDTEMHAAALPDADRAALERPEAVAARFVALLAGGEGVPNGARLRASEVAA